MTTKLDLTIITTVVVKFVNSSCQIRQLRLSNPTTLASFQVETTVSKLKLFLPFAT